MPKREGTGYVMWLGKGAAGNYEWGNRMYQTGNSEGRANRISGYAFNLSGGLGVGAYFEDPVSTSRYVLVTLVVDTIDKSLSPNGLIRMYKNGVLRQSTGLTQSYAKVNPENGTAPFRIGTRNLASYFQGAIAKVAVWPTILANTRITAHYSAMCPSGSGTPGCS